MLKIKLVNVKVFKKIIRHSGSSFGITRQSQSDPRDGSILPNLQLMKVLIISPFIRYPWRYNNISLSTLKYLWNNIMKITHIFCFPWHTSIFLNFLVHLTFLSFAKFGKDYEGNGDKQKKVCGWTWTGSDYVNFIFSLVEGKLKRPAPMGV